MQSKLPSSGTRSSCPVNAAVEVIGDQWTLLILRDMLLQERCRFSEFRGSEESVATNILATRLKHLATHGLIEKFKDPEDGRGALYFPTERALDFIPVLVATMAWSNTHQPETTKYAPLMAAYRSDPHGTAEGLKERARQFRKKVLP
ncbi:MAG: helix-turn-helix domain-containing protein [Pseudomonadota bacterium]